MKNALLASSALSYLASAALAGPNANGTLIAALSEGTVYTTDNTGYCGSSTVEQCETAVTSTSGPTPVVINCIASISGNPRVAGVTFGITYGADVSILEFGPCGDFELADGTWPASGTGTAITWSSAQTDNLIEVYWFAAYSYNDDCDLLQLGPHPTQGGNFGDDDVPSNIDPIAGFGAFGFDCPGVLMCLGGFPGACCFADGTCIVSGTEDECLASGGTLFLPKTACDPNPCPQPWGACCFPDGTCADGTFQSDCEAGGGVYQGDGTLCSDVECPPTPTIDASWGEIKSTYR